MRKSEVTTTSRAKTVGKLLAVNIVLLFVILAGFEIYLRHTATLIIERTPGIGMGIDPSAPEFLMEYTSRGRRLRPNAHVLIKHHYLSGRDINMDVNSLGFRDREIPLRKPADELRILVLGDSITIGDYLQADEVYVERIEYYLNKAIRGKRIEVINAGVIDIGTREEIQILEERGLAVNPDVVMLEFYPNDSRPPWGFPGELGSSGFIRRHSKLADVIYRQLVYWKWIREKGGERFRWLVSMNTLDWMHDRRAFLQLVDDAKYDWGAGWKDESWGVIDGELERLKRLSEKHGFKVVIVVFPVAFQVYARFLENKPQVEIRKRAEKFGFHFFDLLPLLRNYRYNLELFYDQCHPKKFTSDIIGKELAAFLEREVLPDVLSPRAVRKGGDDNK